MGVEVDVLLLLPSESQNVDDSSLLYGPSGLRFGPHLKWSELGVSGLVELRSDVQPEGHQAAGVKRQDL